MERLFGIAGGVALALGIAGCPMNDPGQLRPLFDSIAGLPGFLHPANADPDDPDQAGAPIDGWPRFEMGVRNIGDVAVTITAVTMREANDAPGGDAFFGEPQVDAMTVEPDAQAVVQFTYATPNGQGQSAELVISSDAENAELVIPVASSDYVAVVEDAGDPEPDPLPDGGDDDAGSEPDDAGLGDAGG